MRDVTREAAWTHVCDAERLQTALAERKFYIRDDLNSVNNHLNCSWKSSTSNLYYKC